MTASLAELIGKTNPGEDLRLRQAIVVSAPTAGAYTIRFGGTDPADDIAGVRSLAGVLVATGDTAWVLQTGGALLLVGVVGSTSTRSNWYGTVPGFTGSGAGPTLLGTLNVPAFPWVTFQSATAQMLLNGSATNDQFEVGIYDGATTAGVLLRAIRWHTPAAVGNVDQRDISAPGVIQVAANTAKTYTLWVTRTGGAGTFSCVGDPRYSAFQVEVRAAA